FDVTRASSRMIFGWRTHAPTPPDASARERDAQRRTYVQRGRRRAVSDADFGFQEVVDGLRVRFSARSLHDLADKPPDQRGFCLGLRDLVGIFADDVVYDRLDRAEIGHLLHPARLDDRARIAALGPDDLEQILGDLSRDHPLPDQV